LEKHTVSIFRTEVAELGSGYNLYTVRRRAGWEFLPLSIPPSTHQHGVVQTQQQESRPRKFSSFLQPIKDDLALKMPGVYSIPRMCGKVYIGQTGCSTETRVKEHQRHIRLYHTKKSAVAEHSINLDHRIQLQNTSILAKIFRRMDHIIREATKIPTTRTRRMASH
jgi:hypothetical protein